MFSEEEIIKYADKLLIGLSNDEAITIYNEFEYIDKNLAQINDIPMLSNVNPAFMPYDLYVATLREDEASPSVDVDEALANTKEKIGREIKVPKVVE